MRSFGNRGDAVVVDEPFYAHYLAVTGLDTRCATRSSHRSRPIGAWSSPSLLEPLPPGMQVQFQKQMAHHLLPDMGRDWFDRVTHAFLIRDPRPMLASLARKLETCTLADTGLPQQVEIFEHVVRSTGRIPAVVDSVDLLASPPGLLAPALRARRHPVHEPHARMAHRPTSQRRRLGPTLVRSRRAHDALRARRFAADGGDTVARGSCASSKRRADHCTRTCARTDFAPEGKPCCSASTSAIATWSSTSTAGSCLVTRRA
jgi:hypothetical protein